MTGLMLYEGKAKKIFATDDLNVVRVEYKDSLTAFNAQKKGEFEGKGQINCDVTCLLFEYLQSRGIQTHLQKKLSATEILVTKVKIIPLEVVLRNRLAGSTAKKFGLEEGTTISQPLVEFYYKDDALGDPFISEDQAEVLGFATADQMKELKTQILRINQILKELFLKAGLELIDFKLEFGTDSKGRILLADEMTPDTARLWDTKTQEKMDKDRFRRDLGNVRESYAEVLRRIQGAVNG